MLLCLFSQATRSPVHPFTRPLKTRPLENLAY